CTWLLDGPASAPDRVVNPFPTTAWIRPRFPDRDPPVRLLARLNFLRSVTPRPLDACGGVSERCHRHGAVAQRSRARAAPHYQDPESAEQVNLEPHRRAPS